MKSTEPREGLPLLERLFNWMFVAVFFSFVFFLLAHLAGVL